MPAEYIAHAPVRLVRDAGLHGAAEGYALCVRPRTGGRGDQKRRRLLADGRGDGEQLALQVVHQPVAVLHLGELFVDSDGGDIPAQSGHPGSLHRRQRQHCYLHRFRMG